MDGSCCLVLFWSLYIFHYLSQVQQFSSCRSVVQSFESVVALKKKPVIEAEKSITDTGIHCLPRSLSEPFPPHKFVAVAWHLLCCTPLHPFEFHLGMVLMGSHTLCMHSSRADKFHRMVDGSVATNIGKGA